MANYLKTVCPVVVVEAVPGHPVHYSAGSPASAWYRRYASPLQSCSVPGRSGRSIFGYAADHRCTPELLCAGIHWLLPPVCRTAPRGAIRFVPHLPCLFVPPGFGGGQRNAGHSAAVWHIANIRVLTQIVG